MSEGDDTFAIVILGVIALGAIVILWTVLRFLYAVIFGKWWLHWHLQYGHPDSHDGCRVCDRLHRLINKNKTVKIKLPKATARKTHAG